MDQSSEPLARRLRDAALDRADTGGHRVDDCVLDDDGVIDLGALERSQGEGSIASPAAVLASIRGRLGDAGEVSDLYAPPEPERSRWRIGLRARHAFAGTAAGVDEDAPAADRPSPSPANAASTPSSIDARPAPISRLSMVPLSSPEPDTDTFPTAERVVDSEADSDTEIDLRDGDRPIAACPKCMGLGQRDLFDRFSQVEYFSCDTCNHMWQRNRR